MPCENRSLLLPLTPVFVIVIALLALAPGLVSWWDGRTLRKSMDDPALPERLQAARVRRGTAFGVVFVLLFVASVDALVWSLPLMLAFLMIAAYPLRRALYGETWSVLAYATFFVRLAVAVWGFWVLLGATLWMTSSSDFSGWPASIVLAGVLLIFNARYAEAVRFILRTRPIEHSVLIPRFQGLVEKSGIPVPRFEVVPLKGGVIANALALPSLRRSSVLFSETLLERLDPDEVVGICAHELAHLEHFNHAFLRRINRENILLILLAAFAAPVAKLLGLTFFLLPELLWLMAVAAVIVRRAKNRQRNETASDLRAIQLCGDPEALVRGLTRLYTMARVPRRVDQQNEQHATHPSLARRIRDIRAAAGLAAGSLGAAATFASTDGRTRVTFQEESLNWSEGEGATHTLNYGYLAELRIQARVSRPPTLVAVERAGRRWEITLAQDDLGRAQSVLDIVDARLPEPTAPPSVWPKVSRPVIAFGAMIGLATGQLALALVALLAIVQPSAPLLAATGIASMAAAAVLVRQGDAFGGAFAELALMLAVFGCVLLLVARSKREDAVSRRAVVAVASLGILAAFALTMVLMAGTDPVRLHQSAQSVTSAPVLLLAFAGALTLWRSKAAKYAAIPVIVVAAATTGVASTSFLDRFGDDIFISPAPSLKWTATSGPIVRKFTIPFTGDSLQLSPRGRLLAIGQTGYDDDHDPETRFHVGLTGEQQFKSISAFDLLFLDEERVLLARIVDSGVEVSEVDVRAPGAATWRVHVPGVVNPQLSFDSTTGRWSVLGWTELRGVVTASGIPGSQEMRRQEWASAPPDGGWIKSFATAGDDNVIVVETHYKPGLLHRCGLSYLAWLIQPDLETQFRFASSPQDARVMVSQFDAACFNGGLKGNRLVCSAFDGTRTRFIALDPASRQVSRLGWLDGRYAFTRRPNNGWLSGWRNSTPVALNLERRIAVEGERSDDYRAFVVTGADDMIATMSFNASGSTIRVIRLSNVESSSARVVK